MTRSWAVQGWFIGYVVENTLWFISSILLFAGKQFESHRSLTGLSGCYSISKSDERVALLNYFFYYLVRVKLSFKSIKVSRLSKCRCRCKFCYMLKKVNEQHEMNYFHRYCDEQQKTLHNIFSDSSNRHALRCCVDYHFRHRF